MRALQEHYQSLDDALRWSHPRYLSTTQTVSPSLDNNLTVYLLQTTRSTITKYVPSKQLKKLVSHSLDQILWLFIFRLTLLFEKLRFEALDPQDYEQLSRWAVISYPYHSKAIHIVERNVMANEVFCLSSHSPQNWFVRSIKIIQDVLLYPQCFHFLINHCHGDLCKKRVTSLSCCQSITKFWYHASVCIGYRILLQRMGPISIWHTVTYTCRL